MSDRGYVSIETWKEQERINASLRAEVERLKALLGEVLPYAHDRLPVGPSVRARAALDSSAPAPRTFTEEQVREAWEAGHARGEDFGAGDGDEELHQTCDEFIEALMEAKP